MFIDREHARNEEGAKMGDEFEEDFVNDVEIEEESAEEPSTPKRGGGVRLDVFTASGCHFCAEQKEHLAKLKQEHPDIEIVVHEDEDLPVINGKKPEGVPFLAFSCAGSNKIVGFIDQMAEFDDLADGIERASQKCGLK